MEHQQQQAMENRIRSLILEIFPRYDTGSTGGLNVQQLLPFFNEILPRLGDTSLNNQDKVMKVLQQFDKNSDGKMSKIELFVGLDTVFKNAISSSENGQAHVHEEVVGTQRPIRKPSEQAEEPVQLAPGSPQPTALDLQLKKLIDKQFLKYDPAKKHVIGLHELSFLLNDCFQALGLPNRVKSQQEAQEAFRFVDENHDGHIQKMEVFVLLRMMMLKQL